MTDNRADRLRNLFLDGVRNAHAMEKQALSIMKPQVDRIGNYPEVADRLRAHIEETHGQIERLDEILGQFSTSASALKEIGLSITGTMAAVAHSVAGDEIIKNSFANYAFEHFEIASYKSLITLAEVAGVASVDVALRQSLDEEVAMAEWIDSHLPAVTQGYAQLYADEGAFEAKV